MRKAFVHEATLELHTGGDERAPGAAVTVALCGHWEHPGRCRWPHQNEIERSGGAWVVRVVFAAEPAEEREVRALVERAIRSGALDGPTGTTRWTTGVSGPSSLRPDEAALGEKLVAAYRPTE